jgi:hypothetical protein
MIKQKDSSNIEEEIVSPDLKFDTSEGEVYWMANITFNLYSMFSWALDVKDWKEPVNNKLGIEVLPILERAIKRMIENRKEALKHNAPNLWGTYPYALRFLITCAIACSEYPDYIFNIEY